jgi:hypothetical protein
LQSLGHLQRLRTLDEYDVQDVAQLRDTDPAYPPMPPLVLLTHIPPEDERARLLALMHVGAAVDVRVVLRGEWPPGATVDLAADGTTATGARVHRVAPLDGPSAVDLLRVLYEAHTGEPTLMTLQPPKASTEPGEAENTDTTAPNGGEADSSSGSQEDPGDVESDAAAAHPEPSEAQDSEEVLSEMDTTTGAATPHPIPNRTRRW